MVEPEEIEILEFRWGKKRGVGGKKKDVQFYESFTYDGVEYTLYDCVYLYKDGEAEPYVGKLIKIWEHPDKNKKVKVLWFFHPNQISKYLGRHEKELENELYLASGEGVGLANINSLEAIAGKCNVVCTSKDSRNPQPSVEELQMADFVFYRTFDVGKCKLLDKIDGKIAGIEAKYIFNRSGCQSPSEVPKGDPDKNNESSIPVPVDEAVISSKSTACEEHKNIDGISTQYVGRENQDSTASLTKQKSLVVENSHLHEEKSEMAIADAKQKNIFNEKSTPRFEVKEQLDSKASLRKQSSLVREEPCCSGASKLGEPAEMSKRQENIPDDKHDKRNEDFKVSFNKHKSLPGKFVASTESNDIAKIDERTPSRSKNDFDRKESKVVRTSNGQVEVDVKVEARKPTGELFSRPLKKAKLDGGMKVSDEKSNNSLQRLSINSEIKEGKTVESDVTRDKSKLAKVCFGTEKSHRKEPELSRPSTAKFPKASSRRSPDIDKRVGYKVMEVTRRPDVDDRSKWFKSLPYEERMQVANEEGKLVLLQNLDPSYTSTEVEDIVWHGFKERCTAKVIQRTAFTSPHSGQAFALFNTREGAENVVMKLEDGCLLLSNGRPLVGSIANLCFAKKQSAYIGHLVIDKLKHQLIREMKEAVSTSHCSQPNTIEYEMAMDWCLLQERSSRCWKELYQKQGAELKKLMANLKTKLGS